MPISQNTKFTMPERKEYEALPADMYQVQITDITEKLMVPYGKPSSTPEEEKEMMINFEFSILDEGEYRGRKLWKAVRPIPPVPPEDSKFKPSWMFKIVSAVNGQPMTYATGINWGPDETNGMIGQQIRLTVTKTQKGDKQYNNITEVLAAKVQLPPLEASNEPGEAKSGYDSFKEQGNALNPAKTVSYPTADNGEAEINVEDILMHKRTSLVSRLK